MGGFESTGVHRPQGGGGSGAEQVGGLGVITGQDQGKDQGLDWWGWTPWCQAGFPKASLC